MVLKNGTRALCTLAVVLSLGSWPIAELRDWALESARPSPRLASYSLSDLGKVI